MKPLYVKKNGTVNKVSGVAMPNTFPANRVGYDNTASELEATNTQDAIDEVVDIVANKDREFVYAQKDQNVTITFSGSARTRVPAGLLIVSGQSGIIEPISFMFNGMGYYPTRENINNRTVYLSANGYNITGGIQCINIPAGICANWGYVKIREIGDELEDITITVTYS